MTKQQRDSLAEAFEGLLQGLASGEGMNLPEMIASPTSTLRALCHELDIPIYLEDHDATYAFEDWLPPDQAQDFFESCSPTRRRIEPDTKLIYDI